MGNISLLFPFVFSGFYEIGFRRILNFFNFFSKNRYPTGFSVWGYWGEKFFVFPWFAYRPQEWSCSWSSKPQGGNYDEYSHDRTEMLYRKGSSEDPGTQQAGRLWAAEKKWVSLDHDRRQIPDLEEELWRMAGRNCWLLNLAKNGGLPGYKLLIFDILTLFQNSVYSGNEKKKKPRSFAMKRIRTLL